MTHFKGVRPHITRVLVFSPQYLIEKKLESYNYVKLAPTVSALVTIVLFVIRIKHRLAHQSDRKVKLTITVWPLLRALRLKAEQAFLARTCMNLVPKQEDQKRRLKG